jgi:hypothetical protein
MTMPATIPRRDFTNVGAAYREAAQAAAADLTWVEAGEATPIPAMPGLALASMVDEFRIPRVDRVGYGPLGDTGSGLIALRAYYSNGRSTVYAVDVGTECVPVFIDFEPDVEPGDGVRFLTLTRAIETRKAKR